MASRYLNEHPKTQAFIIFVLIARLIGWSIILHRELKFND